MNFGGLTVSFQAAKYRRTGDLKLAALLNNRLV
jgi:hypothetical protein